MVKNFSEYNEGFDSNLRGLEKSIKKRKSSKVDKVISEIKQLLDTHKHPLGGHTSWGKEDLEQIIDAIRKYQ